MRRRVAPSSGWPAGLGSSTIAGTSQARPGASNHHPAASYVSLHENLLDLAALSFRHAETFGTRNFAIGNSEMTAFQGRELGAAFREHIVGLTHAERFVATTQRENNFELSLLRTRQGWVCGVGCGGL